MERSDPTTRDRRPQIMAVNAPAGFAFPESFLRMIGGDLPDIEPWFWLIGWEGAVEAWVRILGTQFPQRTLVPFAKDGGTDDVFCFNGEVRDGRSPVLMIHSFCSPGWEYRGEWDDFDSWYRAARRLHEEWMEEG